MSKRRKFMAFVPAQDSSGDAATSSPSSKRFKKESMPDTQNINNSDKELKTKVSSFGERQLMKQGWVQGKGLGRKLDGSTSHIAGSEQLGTRGLGFAFKGFESAPGLVVDKEVVNVEQSPDWVTSCNLQLPTSTEINAWGQSEFAETHSLEETEVASIDDFCTLELMQKVWNAKTIFDGISPKEFVTARNRANPFEAIKKAIFCNRAAAKMANIDATFGFRFSRPPIVTDKNEKITNDDTQRKNIENPKIDTKTRKKNNIKVVESLNKTAGLVYFVDLCAGPGGFSEYMLWRRRWHVCFHHSFEIYLFLVRNFVSTQKRFFFLVFFMFYVCFLYSFRMYCLHVLFTLLKYFFTIL